MDVWEGVRIEGCAQTIRIWIAFSRSGFPVAGPGAVLWRAQTLHGRIVVGMGTVCLFDYSLGKVFRNR
jgi:hypothetical protein